MIHRVLENFESSQLHLVLLLSNRDVDTYKVFVSASVVFRNIKKNVLKAVKGGQLFSFVSIQTQNNIFMINISKPTSLRYDEFVFKKNYCSFFKSVSFVYFLSQLTPNRASNTTDQIMQLTKISME